MGEDTDGPTSFFIRLYERQRSMGTAEVAVLSEKDHSHGWIHARVRKSSFAGFEQFGGRSHVFFRRKGRAKRATNKGDEARQ